MKPENQTASTIQKGTLDLYWETGMDMCQWVLFRDEEDPTAKADPYQRLAIIEPGDSLLVFKPGTPNLHRVDGALFDAMALDGREALADHMFTQRLVFGTPALEMDYTCNRTDIMSQEIKNRNMRLTLAANIKASVDDLFTLPGQDFSEAASPGTGVRRLMPLPQPMSGQKLHGATVNGIPATIRPDVWFHAFAGEYPALLVKGPAPVVA